MKEKQTEFSGHTYIIENTKKKKNFPSVEQMRSRDVRPK